MNATPADAAPPLTVEALAVALANLSAADRQRLAAMLPGSPAACE